MDDATHDAWVSVLRIALASTEVVKAPDGWSGWQLAASVEARKDDGGSLGAGGTKARGARCTNTGSGTHNRTHSGLFRFRCHLGSRPPIT